MGREKQRKILSRVRSGELSVKEALEQLRQETVDELGFATLDLQRALRRGFPEVVLGEGKTPSQLADITRSLRRAGQTVLITRLGPDVARGLVQSFPGAEYHEAARSMVLRSDRPRRPRPGIVVMSAGTADLGVAEEAAFTAEVMGNKVERVHDVGVAGLHRVLAHRKSLLEARVIVVVAGMEGALPSVVAGLTDCPVIGVPTSTGYGEGGRGRAALLAMLNSCAAGLTVVNIDHGFSAGYAAALINRRMR